MQYQPVPSRPEKAAPGGTVPRTPLLFLLLVPIFSIPFYFLDRHPLLPEGMLFVSVTSLMVFVPLVLALTFTFKESGWHGVRSHLARALDVHKIKPMLWLLPALVLLPVALYLSFLLSRLLGNVEGEATPLWETPGTTLALFAVLVIFAIAEELGWMGYAADPLQERWGTLRASLIITASWAVWHWVPWFRAHDSIGWVFSMTVVTILLRFLMFWLYNNNRGCVFLTVIFHASFNVGYRLFPNQGQAYDATATALVLGVITIVILSIWRPAKWQVRAVPVADAGRSPGTAAS
ncbi:MAG TPA: CPBP family intramembrane glutamic endopeptidase [Steroidobacter sp.]